MTRGHDRLDGLAAKAFDLDRQDLDARHLRVEERRHPRQRVGYRVRDEQQPQPTRRKVRGHIVPEAVRVGLAVRPQQLRKLVARVAAVLSRAALERLA